MKVLTCLLWALVFFILAGANAKAGYSQYNSGTSTDLNFEKFVGLIERNNLDSIEETLEQLKTYYPEYFETYILMYKSRSIQSASFENPRALLFDRSGEFVFSFNGNPEQKGYNSLEVMQFRGEEDRFEFREIVFKDGKPPEVSEPNPRKCMACHQSTTRQNIDPRPNWEPYSTWPGAYGSIRGNLEVSNYDKLSLEKKEGGAALLEAGHQEKPMLEQFFSKIQPEHSRYRYLQASQFEPGMTTEFTQLMANLNFRRVVRIITEENKDLYKYFELPFLSLVKCQQVPLGKEALEWAVEALPEQQKSVPSLVSKNSEPSIYSIEAQAKRILRQESGNFGEETWTDAELAAKVREVSERRWWVYENSPTLETSEGITLMFEPFGISTEDWSMDFLTAGNLAFKERFGTPSNTRNTLRDSFIQRLGREPLHQHGSCYELSQKAAEQFSGFLNSEAFRQLQEAKLKRETLMSKALKKRCISCHTSYDQEVPYIPFDDEVALARALNEPAQINSRRTLLKDIKFRMSDFATEDQRMPMGPVFSKKQRSQLLEYFERLATQAVD